MEPGFGVGPVAFDGFFGDVEDFGDFGVGHADEAVEFDDFGAHRFFGSELVEEFVNAQEFFRLGFDGQFDGSEFEAFEIPAVFFGPAAASAIDEDAAHHFGSGAEELGAALPMLLVLAGDAEPGFVHQGGGLEGLAGRLALHF